MRWTIKEKPSDIKIQELANKLSVEPLIAQLLLQRGIHDFQQAKKFFRPQLSDLHDPFLMKDMDKAVSRIQKAIANNQNILVFGDYDVDGTTAVSVVASYLKTHSQNIATYIPDRYDEGYGISYKGIDFADDNNISLIIALDCGIKSNAHIEYANQKNIDFIICDHHRPGKDLPAAIAILDPKRNDCNYPFEELCGCGIGFKLIQGLAKNYGETIEDLTPYLDLVATAIAADIVPINGENRILAYFGLQVINNSPRPGIKALIRLVKKETLDITDVVFIIAPRINAAGRIKHGNYAVELLSEYDFEQAQEFALAIEKYNEERKNLDKQITTEALLQIESNAEQDFATTVVFKDNWHKGVIGIVASRLIETYYRPTLVFTKSGDKLAASARSIKDFDIYNALESCSEYLEQFGGHKYAAGMTLKAKNYEVFKNAFDKTVKATIDPNILIPEIAIDAVIDFDQISPKLIRLLKQFEPFGPENMTPIFVSENIYETGFAKQIGADNRHLKLFLRQQNGLDFSAIGFNLGGKIDLISNKKTFKIAYSIEENTWNGNVSTQLKLRDIQ